MSNLEFIDMVNYLYSEVN